jgi:iron-sulfur cluster assembly accessory protein
MRLTGRRGLRIVLALTLIMETIAERDVILSLTEAAATEVRQLQEKDVQTAGRPLRVYIEGGGCSGMQYNMQFDEKREDDVVAEFFGVSVVVDPFSANYLRGAVVDYKDDLNDSGFKVLNPNARQSCGCGKSFEA